MGGSTVYETHRFAYPCMFSSFILILSHENKGKKSPPGISLRIATLIDKTGHLFSPN